LLLKHVNSQMSKSNSVTRQYNYRYNTDSVTVIVIKKDCAYYALIF